MDVSGVSSRSGLVQMRGSVRPNRENSSRMVHALTARAMNLS